MVPSPVNNMCLCNCLARVSASGPNIRIRVLCLSNCAKPGGLNSGSKCRSDTLLLRSVDSHRANGHWVWASDLSLHIHSIFRLVRVG